MEKLNAIIKNNRIIGIIEIDHINNIIDLETSVQEELLDSKRSLKKIYDSLKLVGLNKIVLEKKFSELSSGQQTKVFIAKALLTRSKNIILEDPTNHLDSYSKQNLIKLVKLMKLRYNRSVVIFSHDTDFLHKVSDYIVIMQNNNIVMQGDKYEIFSQYSTLEKYHIKIPTIMVFSKLVKEKKNVNIGFRDDTNDLMKDIYRFAKKNSEE